MSTLSPLIQTITRLSALLPVISSWENCALNIIEKYRPSSVSLFCKSAVQCPGIDFYKEIQAPTQTVFGLETHELPTFNDPDLVILPVFGDFLEWTNDTIWKYRLGGRNKFKIVIVANMSDDRKADLHSMQNLFQAMWTSGVVYTAVLLQNESSVEVFTYIPFQNNESCEDTSPVSLGSCITAVETVFKDKIANLNKCPLRMTFIDDSPWLIKTPFSGRLVHLFHELKFRLNYSFVPMTPLNNKNGGICGPEEFLGVRGQVAKGDAHVGIGSFDRKECSTLEYIGLPYTQCLTWCTPILSATDYVYFFLVKQFEPQVWAAVISTAAVVVISVIVLCSATEEQISSNDAFNLALIVFAQPPPVHVRSTSIRIIIAFWLLTCLVVRTAYEGELKSQSAVPLGSHVIYGMDELSKTDIQLCTVLSSLQFLRQINDDPLIQKLTKMTQICNGTLYENSMAAAKYKDRAVFTSDLRCSAASSQTNPEKASLYPFTGGCIKMNQITPMVLTPGSPFKEILKTIPQRCIETGLLTKWLDLRPIQREVGTLKPFSLSHLFPALFVLGVGCLVGLFIFLTEKALNRWSCLGMKKTKRYLCKV